MSCSTMNRPCKGAFYQKELAKGHLYRSKSDCIDRNKFKGCIWSWLGLVKVRRTAACGLQKLGGQNL